MPKTTKTILLTTLLIATLTSPLQAKMSPEKKKKLKIAGITVVVGGLWALGMRESFKDLHNRDDHADQAAVGLVIPDDEMKKFLQQQAAKQKQRDLANKAKKIIRDYHRAYTSLEDDSDDDDVLSSTEAEAKRKEKLEKMHPAFIQAVQFADQNGISMQSILTDTEVNVQTSRKPSRSRTSATETEAENRHPPEEAFQQGTQTKQNSTDTLVNMSAPPADDQIKTLATDDLEALEIEDTNQIQRQIRFDQPSQPTAQELSALLKGKRAKKKKNNLRQKTSNKQATSQPARRSSVPDVSIQTQLQERRATIEQRRESLALLQDLDDFQDQTQMQARLEALKYDQNGFDADGKHKVTKEAYDQQGLNKFRYDKNGFFADGTHHITGTPYDENDMDKDGQPKPAEPEPSNQEEQERRQNIALTAQAFIEKYKDEALAEACQLGNLDLVKYLVEEEDLGLDENNRLSAMLSGSLALIQYLETKGLEVDQNDLWGACNSGNLDLVKYLVEEKGLEVDQNDMWGACDSGNLDLVKYLVEEEETRRVP